MIAILFFLKAVGFTRRLVAVSSCANCWLLLLDALITGTVSSKLSTLHPEFGATAILLSVALGAVVNGLGISHKAGNNASADKASGRLPPNNPPNKRSAPLPRPQRKPQRARADRGLPPDEELAKLATEYLNHQRKLWPHMVKAGLLPESTIQIVREMVEDFKTRHRTGNVDVEASRAFAPFATKFAGSYGRYSCDNSNPNSIIDQMTKMLDKAHEEGRFVPWLYVFADYSVTGLDGTRQGYSSYKGVLSHKEHRIETTYIDDFTRASRDELEWWRLASLSKQLNKRMIGASDGFNLSDPNWDIWITIFGLLSRLFIKSLREKVRRGMKGAARRGNHLGRLPLGFTRDVQRDVNGEPVHDKDGRPVYVRCIDPSTRESRLLLYKLYVREGWSLTRITKHFNQLKIDGSDIWSHAVIRHLLWSPSAIGIFIWNQNRHERDWESRKWRLIPNPRSEWEIHFDRDLAIVPLALWRAARRKLATARRANPQTGRKPSRNENSATTLFSGTLVCEYCNNELNLGRSAGQHKQLCCENGQKGAHGCGLTSSKSTKIIENCLLSHITDAILTDASIDDLIAKANVFVEQIASAPQVDIAPLRANGKVLESKIEGLFQCVEAERGKDSPDLKLCTAYDKRISDLQGELEVQQAALQTAQRNNRVEVRPLDVKWARTALADLTKLLRLGVPMAAEAIRTLTGPIKIRQEKYERKRGARWVATFTPDLVAVLRQLAIENGTPDRAALATIRNTADLAEVVIDTIPTYVKLAPQFKALYEQGKSVDEIAAVHGFTKKYVRTILDFGLAGKLPRWVASNAKRKTRSETK
ncbi:MAG TPA: recombinase family protein [Pirellulales bacterium]|jgi:DNA invertase Pin-like site-specific DNA recombinase